MSNSVTNNTSVYNPIIRDIGTQDYVQTWRAMQEFSQLRNQDTPDELWLVQHLPVFTLGLNGKAEHIIATSDIPVVNVDRGGQVTYHGPGQLVIYLLVNLKSRGYGIREFVRNIELSIIKLLAEYDITATGKIDAPGVYVNDNKIAALGLRVKNNCTYHGLALNIDMDLSPFSLINPCGYPGLTVTDMRQLNINDPFDSIKNKLTRLLVEIL